MNDSAVAGHDAGSIPLDQIDVSDPALYEQDSWHPIVGGRRADLQLRILREEILERDLDIEVMGRPRQLYSNFFRGIRELPGRIKA